MRRGPALLGGISSLTIPEISLRRNDWLLLAQLMHYHKGTYYGYKLKAVFQWCVFFYVRLRTCAQYPSMNEFTCSEHSVSIRRSKKCSTRNQPLLVRRAQNFGQRCSLDYLLLSFKPAQVIPSGAWSNTWTAGNNNVWAGMAVHADDDAAEDKETGFWAEAVRVTSKTGKSQPQPQKTNANQTRVR